MQMGRAVRRLAGALALLVATTATAIGEGARELAAGGLMLVPDYALSIESHELSLARDEVKATLVVRNASTDPRTILLTLPLPDIDALGLSDQAPSLPHADPVNFIGLTYAVDGVALQPRFEQRALVLGLDVTPDLLAAGLPLFPLGPELPDRLKRLPDTVRTDFAERGIVRIEDERVLPSWTLKTVGFWRQTFAPLKAATLTLAYRPVLGAPKGDAVSIEALRRSHCLDAGTEAEIARRTGQPRTATAGPVLVTLAFALTANASWPPQSASFRLLVKKPAPDAIIATCRKGLTPVGPTVLEWTAKDFYPDDDIAILFVK